MATQAKQKQGHTPGPWKLDAKPGLPVYVYAQQPVAGSIPPLRLELASVCSLEDGRHNEQKRAETLANARLIAAAPDLLAALEELARAAIAAQAYVHTGCHTDERHNRVNNELITACKVAGSVLTQAGG